MATSVCKGQIPQRPQGQYTCIHHKARQLDLYCKTCEEPVCTKCLSSIHAGHLLCELGELTSEKKQDIRSFIDKTENIDLVELNKFINSADNSLKETISCFEKLSEQLNTQTTKLKEELDLLVAQTLSLYQQMEEDNAKLLHTYKQDLEMYSEQLKQKVEDCKGLLQRGSDIEIYDTDCDVTSSVSLPVKPTLATASFTPNSNPQRYLEQALGEIETLYKCQSHGRPRCDLTVRSHEEDGPSAQRQMSETDRGTDDTKEEMCNRGYRLLPESKVLRKCKSPCDISSICPTTDGRAWTKFLDTLTLLDRNGKVVEKVKHNTKISDISLSPTTNTLWACDKYTNILELEAGRLQTRFSTNAEHLSICITASEHVIIGMDNKISKFTTSGELVQTTVETEGRFVTRSWRMSECPVTHNIAVVNHRRDVVIMDSDLQELFVYTGDIPDVYTPTPGDKSFDPVALVYDSMGNLVIGDRNNKRLVLISGRGQFIRIIHTDDRWSQAVGIDVEGVLWSVFRSDDVKLLQYNDMYQKEDGDEYKEDDDEYKEDNDEYKEDKKCVMS